MPADTATVARLMKTAGYATGLVGKWGLAHPGSASTPDPMGFDHFFGHNCQWKAHENAAVSTFHFGTPHFTNNSPFLMQFVALQDAHGPEPWWFADTSEGFRTLFLAREPSWDGWLATLRNNWVAAVRRDAVSGGRLWLHAGQDDVASRVREREADCRWWDNPALRRPLASVVAVTPADAFEAWRPDKGVVIRVRCAWSNTTQGQPKAPLAELVRLTVDGAEVRPEVVTRRRPKGSGLADHYHAYRLPDPRPDRHTAAAVVRSVAAKVEETRAIEFTV